ncbi:PREDICTED: prostamide/prostaglandin F synthase-like isoform X2 [Papilio polytes]|uniref:prostamide/prostaglandin F synthase-like isoform X2 n=1 Tax=Papilio polytes TaxID=76194 RepID=UPI000676044A|nr:PREDICTED: prostamide/prostaglandin F synthase-like isoform X2 [Papilio polytes]
MSVDINAIGSHKIRSVPGGEQVELKTFWQDQDAVVIFFRRWGCMLCRLWAKELSEIAPVLKKNNIKLVGIGVENAGSKDFMEGKYFDGELYHVEDISTYNTLGFKRFNVVSIITSLFWKQSREAIAKGRGMGLHSDLIGDSLQNGGCLLIQNGGKSRHFVQLGPADMLPNVDILEHFNLEAEYKEETMANKVRDNIECNKQRDKPSIKNFLPFEPIHVIWCSRRCKQTKV